jgi:hypothetical protein
MPGSRNQCCGDSEALMSEEAEICLVLQLREAVAHFALLYGHETVILVMDTW